MTQPVGTLSFCCVAGNNLKQDEGFTEFDGMQLGVPFMLDKGATMADVWNGKHMKHIRRQMDVGEKVVGCEPCYDLEKYGIPSYRENYIKDWMGFHRECRQSKRNCRQESIENGLSCR